MIIEIISVVTLLSLPLTECRGDVTGGDLSGVHSVSAMIAGLLKQIETIPPGTVLGTVARMALRINKVKDDKCFKILYESFASGYLDTTFDSFGKVPSSLLKGNLKWSGNYDECANGENIATAPNKYCWLSIAAPNNSLAGTSVASAICLPSNCSTSAINEYFRGILDLSILPLNLEAKLSCMETTNLDSASITALSVIAILSFFCLVGTILDIFESRAINGAAEVEDAKPFCRDCETTEPTWKTIAYGALKGFSLCFSLPRSLSFLTSTSGVDQRVSCLDGVRVLSNVWIILGHVYLMFLSNKNGNLLDALNKLDTWHFQTTRAQFFGVDTFFLLRLTPTYAVVILLYATLLKRMVVGPFKEDGFVVDHIRECSTTWFYNLLYISNFQSLNRQCMIWGWYLSVDFQFFLISPAFLIFLKRKNAVLGLVVLFAVFVASSAVSGWKFYSNDVILAFYKAAQNIETAEKNITESWEYYSLTYTRIGPFLVGSLLAFVFVRIPSEFKLKKIYLMSGWIASAALNVSVVYGLLNKEIDRTDMAFYNTFARTAFATSVAWLVFVCAQGLGGKVNDLLSWRMWIPLGRLSFGSYLLHPCIMYLYFGTLRSPFYFTLLTIIPIFLGVSFLSYTFSVVLYCLVEYPFSRLQNKLRKALANANAYK